VLRGMVTTELSARYADPPRRTFHTMDPGTVDTKMLRAGWGSRARALGVSRLSVTVLGSLGPHGVHCAARVEPLFLASLSCFMRA
jgi:hypothetical protein